MTTTIRDIFHTLEEAETALDRLVEEYGIDRAAIVVSSDVPSPHTQSAHLVVVSLDDDVQAQEALATFGEFSADEVEQG